MTEQAKTEAAPLQSATLTEVGIMRHALGADSRDPGYRNQYCVADGDKVLSAMVEKGLMREGRTINQGRDRYYHVTDEWSKALGIMVRR